MNHYKLPSQKYLKECLDYDSETGVFTWKKRPESHFSTTKGMRISNRKYAGKKAGTKVKSHSGKSYLVIMISGVQHKAHNIAWVYENGDCEFEFVDHISGNGLDNRIKNLRAVNLIGNSRNHRLRADNSSGCAGVSFCDKTKNWRARISNNGRRIHLGVFQTFDEAVKARKDAEVQYGYHENHGTERPL